MIYVVYIIIFVRTGRVVYVGCTCRDQHHRSDEHFNIRGGAPRVAIAFAQNRFQPREEFFRFEMVWSGFCTIDQLHAIEQHFIKKYNTRINPRPSNGVTKDIDLMTCDEPLQLNINNSCNCDEHLLWAAYRIQHDSTITVQMNTFDGLMLKQCLEIEAYKLHEVSKTTAYSIIQWAYTKYEAMNNEVFITEFHSDLNDVNQAYVEDDGKELKDNLMILMTQFNSDKRGKNYSLRPSTVSAYFLTLLRTLNPYAHMHSSEPIALDEYLSESMREDHKEVLEVPDQSNIKKHFENHGKYSSELCILYKNHHQLIKQLDKSMTEIRAKEYLFYKESKQVNQSEGLHADMNLSFEASVDFVHSKMAEGKAWNDIKHSAREDIEREFNKESFMMIVRGDKDSTQDLRTWK